jgi:triacylglycerol lipase
MSTIVLAHGLFGFGDLLPGFSLVNYFNGVRQELERNGHTVIVPTVNPIGSIKQRGAQLAKAILQDPKAVEGMHILAHSMGGLDARQALTNSDLARQIATLVTIGTPHRGSEVADAIVDSTGPLFERIPSPLLKVLKKNAGAFEDLTTRICIPFDDSTDDVDGVRYIEIAGDASQAPHELLLFDLAAMIGEIEGVNDGVVARSSALRQVEGHEHLDDWPVDHLGEIGWGLDSPAPIVLKPPLPLFPAAKRHLARYDAIVTLINTTAKGAGAG